MIRTRTNKLAIIFPILTLTFGVFVVKNIQYEKIFTVDSVAEFIRLSILSNTIVLAFCFHSSVFISLPVLER